jgi:hypothetical protein
LRSLARAVMLAITLAVTLGPAAVRAEDKAQVFATNENGFGRLILDFAGRLDLPAYRVKHDNGVLAVEFDEPVDLFLPDVAAALRDYISVARVDPDSRGVRFGLRKPLQVSRLEAGERLFIDLLPRSWQGLPPALPPEVVAELAERAKQAAVLAEQKRKEEEAKTVRPTATVRVGRNPTFARIQFDWSVETKARFEQSGNRGLLTFDWPVPVSVSALGTELPREVIGIRNFVAKDGSHIEIRLADGVVPRFYVNSDRQFVIDVDIAREEGMAAAIAASESEEQQRALEEAVAKAEAEARADAESRAAQAMRDERSKAVTRIVPTVSTIGATVRVTFPFEDDTAAAVFRRGDIIWMLFDTALAIEAPAQSDALSAIARDFTVVSAGGTKIARLDLSSERLATLGSEGRSWVLSLGDVLLNPTEPVAMRRDRDTEGRLLMSVDLQRPSQLHEFRDPVVGDMLKVVTVFPPARGVGRNLQFVDFDMLRSVHGLVIRGDNSDLRVSIEGGNAILHAADGLSLSTLDQIRSLDSATIPAYRSSYVDFMAIREDDPLKFVERREALVERAARSEGRLRDLARLELSHFLLANAFAHEAIGVLSVLDTEIVADDLKRRARLTRGIADVLAWRPGDALAILSSEAFAEEVDASMWRTMARAALRDFAGARADAIAAEGIIDAYPSWIRTTFLLAAARSAIETRDSQLALRYLDMVAVAKLAPEEVTLYHLLQGRAAELDERIDEALDIYGQVIAADVRPTRAEAVYRTLLLLDKSDQIDLARATATLAAEAMLWRGDSLEADMQKLLAQLYFRHKQYRAGFETVRQAATYHPENQGINEVLAEAQSVFGELYLNGRADELDAVEALSLYYDFSQLTPPGNRGDEMIRNLARRLVKVDLLTQAADLLEYQIDSRLKGAAQAQVAADLALIRLADRDPEGALRALNNTRLSDLPPQLERQRRILEARALLDAGREQLAVDLLTRVEGRDADMLRVEGHWRSKNYARAAELLEVMYSPGRHPDPLSQLERMHVIRSAVGFVLAGDDLALSRLRSKFADRMAQTPEWPMFDFVTGEATPQSVEFKKVAREISGLDSLNAFLEAYRHVYAASDGLAPLRPSAADEA